MEVHQDQYHRTCRLKDDVRVCQDTALGPDLKRFWCKPTVHFPSFGGIYWDSARDYANLILKAAEIAYTWSLDGKMVRHREQPDLTGKVVGVHLPDAVDVEYDSGVKDCYMMACDWEEVK